MLWPNQPQAWPFKTFNCKRTLRTPNLHQQEMGYENCEVSKEGLLLSATSNVAMKNNEQGRAFQGWRQGPQKFMQKNAYP